MLENGVGGAGEVRGSSVGQGNFYKSVAQEVLLYRSEIWFIKDYTMKVL